MYSPLIEKLNIEIDKLVKKESNNVTTQGQYQLHLLLENKEQFKKMLSRHEGEKGKTEKTAVQISIDELEDYYGDYIKHKNLYMKTQDADEKTHMSLELKKFAVCFRDIFESMWAMTSTAEEKKVLAQLSGGFATIAEHEKTTK